MLSFLSAFGACRLKAAARWVRRIKESSGSALYTNIDQAVRGIISLVPQASDEFLAPAEK